MNPCSPAKLKQLAAAALGEPDLAAHVHRRSLGRPDVGAAVGGDHLDRRRLAELELDRDLG